MGPEAGAAGEPTPRRDPFSNEICKLHQVTSKRIMASMKMIQFLVAMVNQKVIVSIFIAHSKTYFS
jgi:hypothetical protein